MKQEKYYSIGELAEMTNVNVETIRFYERKKILIQPPKMLGRRQYGKDHVNHLKFIRQAQKVGFSLFEIKELMNLKLNPSRSCLEIKNKTAIKIKEVSTKIDHLKKILKLLKEFESKCDGNETSGKCTILDGLKRLDL